MNHQSKSRPIVVTVLLVVVGLILGGAIRIFFFKDQTPAAPVAQDDVAQQPPLTEEQLVEFVAQARTAVGMLENDRFADAEKKLVELRQQQPDEPMIVRNLAIARLRLFQDNKTEASSVEESLVALRKAEPDAASTHWLVAESHAKMAELATDDVRRTEYKTSARQSLERAAELDRDNAVFAYQLYDFTKFDEDEAIVKAGYAALVRANEIRPDNIFILTELLSAQIKAKDPAIEKTIADAKQVLAPLASTIETRTRINVLKMLEQAASAAAMGNWAVANRNIAPLMGTVRSEEVAKSDMRRIDINPLELVVHEVSAPLMDRYPKEEIRGSPAPIVQFLAGEAGDTVATWTDVLDVRFADFDLDNQPDLLVLRKGRFEVYRLSERGAAAEQIVSIEVPADFSRFLIADLDQDTIAKSTGTPEKNPDPAAEAAKECFRADGDLILYGAGGFLAMRNDGPTAPDTKRTLLAIPQENGVESNIATTSAALIDLDHDGDLDFVASTAKGIRLWSNRGKLLFEDMSQFSILPPSEPTFSTLAIVDWDRDVDVDIIASGANGSPDGLLESLRHGQFRWRPFEQDLTGGAVFKSLLPLEADGNASWDLAGVGSAGVQLALTKTLPATSVSTLKQVALAPDSFDHLVIADFDNNGYRDFLTWSNESHEVFRGFAGGVFQPGVNFTSGWPVSATRCEAADVDADGDIDLAVVAEGKLQFFRNEGNEQGKYVVLRCHGDDDNQSGRVNHWGIGTLIEMKAGSAYQAQTVTGDSSHFGLGAAKKADLARILWTQGIPQAVIEPAASQVICAPMMLKGSCPYAYTWNGQRFEFFTDLLWAAPLGLQFADGVIAPDRPWEYLKLPGEKLAPKDGYYELRITEELWEAAYFDHVELIAVDHPASAEVFTNEKVGPPSIAEHRIHTVQRRRAIQSATDQTGRNWLSTLEQADGQVVKAFDSTLRQGLAQPHYLELDLGQLDRPQVITLFLTGWIRPTDTSLNVAISHHPDLSAPKPPSIWVPDANGQWREALPYMGFPGGKTKTIAVDISKLFAGSDYRLRIQTSAELYWDEAFFTADDEPVQVEVLPLQLASADLQYRGFSQAIVGPRTVPDGYDYERVDRWPRWPPMRGPLTRFGDVRPLLESMDSRLVVMGSGDEIRLQFHVPSEAPRPGWKRDFILHNVGWDKDADLNTVFGQTVEPLPFIGMEAYPYIDSHLIDNESYRDYLRTYQTRLEGRDAFWKQLLE